MKRICFIITALTSLLIWKSSFAQKKELENNIQEILKKYEAVGLAVQVVKDNKVVYKKAFGYADLESGKKLKTDGVFRIASISKSFTATALMQLVEEGKVSLEDDFGDLVGFPVRNPNFPDEVITLEMVLSHTSSISDQNGYFTLDVINPEKNKDWAKSYSTYRPGSQYQYCNLNYNMAGAVIERLTGHRFDHEISDRILKPLKLKAGYNVDELDAHKFVKLYSYNEKEKKYKAQPAAYNSPQKALENYQLGVSTPVFSPTGGMKISSDDLTTYMRMHMNFGHFKNQNILAIESSKSMQNPRIETKYGGYGLALTQNNTLIPDEEMIGHTGDAYGLYSNMYFEPNKKFGFVVITNGARASYDREDNLLFSKEVLNILYDHFIKH